MSPSPRDDAFARFCRSGDPDALGEVYDATADRLLRTALHLAPSIAAAEDLVQATFLAAIEKAPTFAAGRPVLPWLLGILANQARSARWRAQRTPVPDPAVAGTAATAPPAPFAAVAHDEFQAALDAAIDDLPAAYRPVLLLRLRHDMPAAEIALVLGRPAGTVRAQLSRGMERLRQALPAGFGALLAGVVTARGLAAVREQVMAEAASFAATAGISTGLLIAGGVVMKQVVLGVIAVAALACAVVFWPGIAVPGGTPEPRPAQPDRLTAQHPETQPDREAIEAPIAAPTPARARDAATAPPAAPETGSLRVRVLYRKDRAPVPRATVVVVRGGHWDEWYSAQADDEGVVRLPGIPPGSYVVSALRGGETTAVIRAGGASRATVTVPAGVHLVVETVDGAGMPIPGAAVWLSERWRTSRGAIVGHTDAAGQLELRDAAPECNVAARCRGFEPSPVHPIGGTVGTNARVRLTLQRGGGEVRGAIVDEGGRPVAGARVLVGTERPARAFRAADGGWIPGPAPLMVRSDAEGAFHVDGVGGERVAVQVRHPDFAPYRGEFAVAPVAPRDRIVLRAGVVLTGAISTPAGEPAAFAMVTIGDPLVFASTLVQCDAGGRFRAGGLGAGEVTVSCRWHKQRAEARLTLRAGLDNEWNPVLGAIPDVPPGEHLLSGRVVDALDHPLAEWRVVAQPDAGQETRSTTTRLDGQFRLAVPWETSRVWVHPPLAFRSFPAWIRSGVRAEEELLIRVEDDERRAATVRGVVVDKAGRPVQATVQAWHETSRLWRQFETDAETGAFEIAHLPPGTLELKVCPREHPWIRLPPRTLEAGQRVDLGHVTVEAAGRITGQARFTDGRAPADLKVTVIDQKGQEAAIVDYADGGYRTGALAAGTYDLRVQGDRVAVVEQKVTVAAGETVTVDLALAPAALRVLVLELPEGLAQPQFLNVQLRDARSRLVWHGGAAAGGALDLRVSAPPGAYRLNVYGPGSKTWLDRAFTIDSLADEPAPTRVRLSPPKAP